MRKKKTRPGKIRSSLAKRNIQKLLSNRLAIIGCTMLIIMILCTVLAPLLTKYDPTLIDPSIKSQPPSKEHILGTDRVGRDLWARLLYGGRVSISIGIISALGAAFIGVVIGCVSGYYGGKVDKILLYFSELLMSFPQILLILICVGFLGQGIEYLVLIFSLTGWCSTHRIVRGCIMSLKEEPFVVSCKANGIPGWSIMFRQLLPNTLGPVIVSITLSTAGYVLQEAGLSFLGLGVPSEVPTWGNIINAAKRLDIIQTEPLLWVLPGIAISLFVLAVNFFGDGLRDVFDSTQ